MPSPMAFIGGGGSGGTVTPDTSTLQQVTNRGNTTNKDIIVTDATKGVVLTSPDGNRHRVTIDDDRTLNSGAA